MVKVASAEPNLRSSNVSSPLLKPGEVMELRVASELGVFFFGFVCFQDFFISSVHTFNIIIL